MERYEQQSVIGEGSYGLVMKCRHRETDQIVAVKKFLETEEDAGVRKMALREIRMLKKLKHENLVTMIEVFRHKKRFYLVFEYLEGTVLDELEKMPGGLGDDRCRERIYQVTRAINYCHSNHIIHRDIKPENVLVSSMGVVKLCDFGFARLVGLSGEHCTEYVATRWYRAPELLVGETQYGAPVDIWAIGCLFAEMMTGDPMFPGESDIDQLYLIIKMIGKPSARHQHLMAKNSQLRGMMRSAASDYSAIYRVFPSWSLLALDFIITCMKMDPQSRPTSEDLLKHNFFMHDKFPQRFLPALREKVNCEFNSNPMLRKFKVEILMSTDKRDEIKPRRSSQIEAPRWRINLIQGSVKRKFSCDTMSDSLNTEKKESRNMMKTYTQRSGISFIKQPSKERITEQSSKSSVKETEIGKLEKSLVSLSKFATQKSDHVRPTSEQKLLDSPKSASTPPFQSLQSFGDQTKSSNNILHPSIHNIGFSKEISSTKKSPNILQSIHNTSIKGTFHQVPLLTAPKGSFTKKLERNVIVDNIPIETLYNHSGHQTNTWITNFGGNQMKKKEFVKSKDDFTLPNLPGATISPGNNKKKHSISPDHLSMHIVTPELRYKKAKRKYITLDLMSPFLPKEKRS